MRKGRVWITVLIWVLSVVSFAQVGEAEDGVLGRRFTNRWDGAVEHLGHPGALTSEEQLKVFVEVSGGYANVTVAGFGSVEAKSLAEILDEWNGASAGAEYAEEEGGPAAVSRQSFGGFGKGSAVSEVDLGALQTALVDGGFEPYLALYVPIESDGSPELAEVDRGKRWILTKVEGEWPVVSRSTRMKWFDLPATGIVLFGPFVALLGIGVAMWFYCRNEAIELAKRKKAYQRWVGTGVYIPLLIGMPLMFVAFGMGSIVRIADIWMSSSSVSGFIPLVPVTFLVAVVPFWLLTRPIENKYLMDKDAEGNVIEAPAVTMDRVGGKEDKKGILVLEVLRIPIAFGLLFFAPNQYQLPALITATVILFIPYLIKGFQHLSKRDVIDESLAEAQDDPLVAQVLRVARLMNVRVRAVEIARGGKPGKMTGVVYMNETVTLGADLSTSGDDDMVDAAIALAMSNVHRVYRILLLPFLIVFIPVVLGYFVLTLLIPGGRNYTIYDVSRSGVDGSVYVVPVVKARKDHGEGTVGELEDGYFNLAESGWGTTVRGGFV